MQGIISVSHHHLIPHTFRKVTEDDIDMSFQGRDIEVASVESSLSF